MLKKVKIKVILGYIEEYPHNIFRENYAQWVQIGKLYKVIRIFNMLCMNMASTRVPTITSVSRQAIFSGEIPMYFSESINTTVQEPKVWQLFWENHQIMPMYTFYGKLLGQENEEWLAGSIRVPLKSGLVIDLIDRLMHNSSKVTKESTRSWRYG